MRGHRRWVGLLVLIAAVGICGALAVSCGSGGSGGGGGTTAPQTGIRVLNNATSSTLGANIHVITRVDIGGMPAVVHIPPGQSLVMPTSAGSHMVNVAYSNNKGETVQTPPDPVVVTAGQVVLVDFVQ